MKGENVEPEAETHSELLYVETMLLVRNVMFYIFEELQPFVYFYLSPQYSHRSYMCLGDGCESFLHQELTRADGNKILNY